jgi:CO/xanthine dehydrogenase FAD-binding subunit
LREYCTPENDHSLVALLQRYQGNALIVGGGTFVHGLSARGLLTEVEALIDIQQLGLDYVRPGPQGLVLGATATFAQLQAEPKVLGAPWHGAISDALRYPPVQVRNTATFGGCVASSCPYFDVPVGLLAVDAVVKVQGPGGHRDIALEKFFTGLFANALLAGEFVREVVVPPAPARSASAFIKIETNANDLAILNAAVSLATDASGKCSSARVFIGGGVGETPVRSAGAEKTLLGQKPSADLFAQAGKAAQAGVNPMSDHRASAAYRRAMTRVLVERSLKMAADRLG